MFSFPRSARILKGKQYQEIRKLRQYYTGQILTIQYRLSEQPLLGMVASKKFGNAVKRNFLKRRLREAFRLMRHQLPPLAMVVMPKRGATEFSLDLIIKDFLSFAHEHAQSPTTQGR